MLILVFGTVAQWLSWRLGIPAILLLLISGFLAGPVSSLFLAGGEPLINPDALFGDLLFPAVSLSVAVILFEGGLSLRLSDLEAGRSVVRNLVTVGALITWILSAAASYFCLGVGLGISCLLGAILTVTGPTVVVPILRNLAPRGQLGPILKWEGIVIDPIGAMLAVLVFEQLMAGGAGGMNEATSIAFYTLGWTIFLGAALGAVGAFILVLMLSRHWLPDYLQNPATLMALCAMFACSNQFQEDSGLVTVTFMGILLANQDRVAVKHIIDFKENLTVLLISGLFVVLAARMSFSDFESVGWGTLVFLTLLIVVVRPLSVYVCTLGSKLSWQEKTVIACMAPRGIVAAAISSVFAYDLVQAGYETANQIVPVTFMVIVGTVIVYGLTVRPLATLLKVADPNPQGVLILGAQKWARELAEILSDQGCRVLLADTNWKQVSAARQTGIPAFYGNILEEASHRRLDLDGIGRLFALTSNDEVNSLGSIRFSEDFGRSEVYQLAPEHKEERNAGKGLAKHLRGRHLFEPDVTYSFLTKCYESGAKIKRTRLSNEFRYEEFKALYGEMAIPLFLINEEGQLQIFTVDHTPNPRPGHTLISLIDPSLRKRIS